MAHRKKSAASSFAPKQKPDEGNSLQYQRETEGGLIPGLGVTAICGGRPKVDHFTHAPLQRKSHGKDHQILGRIGPPGQSCREGLRQHRESQHTRCPPWRR